VSRWERGEQMIGMAPLFELGRVCPPDRKTLERVDIQPVATEF